MAARDEGSGGSGWPSLATETAGSAGVSGRFSLLGASPASLLAVSGFAWPLAQRPLAVSGFASKKLSSSLSSLSSSSLLSLASLSPGSSCRSKGRIWHQHDTYRVVLKRHNMSLTPTWHKKGCTEELYYSADTNVLHKGRNDLPREPPRAGGCGSGAAGDGPPGSGRFPGSAGASSRNGRAGGGRRSTSTLAAARHSIMGHTDVRHGEVYRLQTVSYSSYSSTSSNRSNRGMQAERCTSSSQSQTEKEWP